MNIYIRKLDKKTDNFVAYVKPHGLFNPNDCFSVTFCNNILGLITISHFIEMIKVIYTPDKI